MTAPDANRSTAASTNREQKGRRSPNRRRAAAQLLDGLARAGVTHITKPRRNENDDCFEADADSMIDVNSTGSQSTGSVGSMDLIRQEVAKCTRCAELASTRNTTVFGEGNPNARLVFMGEAPGADEDRQGRPFVGRAGQLLTKIIEACTLTREDVFILNTLKCRPPGNRNPLPSEAAACREFLDRQLSAIRPEFICCLGSVAAQNLLETDTSIGRLRGSFHDYQGIKVLCTYHPAYLLRNPAAKRMVWDDMQLLMAEMGIELPQKK